MLGFLLLQERLKVAEQTVVNVLRNLEATKQNGATKQTRGELLGFHVLQERLKVAEQAVAAALSNPKRAKHYVDSQFAKELLMHQDNMSMVLAPFRMVKGTPSPCYQALLSVVSASLLQLCRC